MYKLFKKRNFLFFGLIAALVIVEIGLVAWLVFTPAPSNQAASQTQIAATPGSSPEKQVTNAASPGGSNQPPASVPRPPTPTLVPLTAPLNPQHGIHAPVGHQWTDGQRAALNSFQNAAGEKAAPGLVVALNSDMTAANNREGIRLEEDLFRYQRQGSQIFIRMYPQRFPGGFSETPGPNDGRNTLSGTPEDAAEDIFRFLRDQQQRTGQHFTRLIPGNEPNLEWPNGNYYQNVLPWQSNDDPAKYDAINSFMAGIYRAWQARLQQPDAAPFRDVMLYFPAMAQDGHPDYFGGAYFYGDNKPVANKYDRLRPAIELFGRFTWHNYFRPGKAWDDRAVAAFPLWLQQGLAQGWPSAITEAGWTPDALALPAQRDPIARIARFWRRLGWDAELARDDRLYWRTQNEAVAGFNFEDDLQYFITNCAGATGNNGPVVRPGIAVWLAGSEGNFVEAIGVEPGPNGAVRRWLSSYAAWKK